MTTPDPVALEFCICGYPITVTGEHRRLAEELHRQIAESLAKKAVLAALAGEVGK